MATRAPSNMIQFVYCEDWEDPNTICRYFREEAEAMRQAGFAVGLLPLPQATQLVYRSTSIFEETNYPTDIRFLHRWEQNRDHLFLSHYYPYISDLTMETFFADVLDERVELEIQRRGWKKAFIKREVRALEHIEEGLSVWPDHSLSEMSEYYDQMPWAGLFCIRAYYPQKELEEDERYWVIRDKIYHRSGHIPKVVEEAVARLAPLCGVYYAIDATPNLIIEVNPGESSDRHAVNSAELFAQWWKDALIHFD